MIHRASGIQTKGESGRPSTPDNALYNIPVFVADIEVARARVTPEGRVILAMNGKRSEAGTALFNALQRGDADGLTLGLRLITG